MKRILFLLTITAALYTSIDCAEKTQAASTQPDTKDVAQTEKAVGKLAASPGHRMAVVRLKPVSFAFKKESDNTRPKFGMTEPEELPWDLGLACSVPDTTKKEVPYHLLPTLLTQELLKTRKECYQTLKPESKSEKKGPQDTPTTGVDNAPAKSKDIKFVALADLLNIKEQNIGQNISQMIHGIIKTEEEPELKLDK